MSGTGGLSVRAMTAPEWDALRGRIAADYAADQVRAGRWAAEGATARAAAELVQLLPEGIDTPGSVLLVGEDDQGEVVGHVWAAVSEAGRAGAWVYDLQVRAGARGRGYGRALLGAAEDAARAAGAASIGLNVFGHNRVARALYESAGYEPVSLQLAKPLSDA